MSLRPILQVSACLSILLVAAMAAPATARVESRSYLATTAQLGTLGLGPSLATDTFRFQGAPVLTFVDAATDRVPVSLCAYGADGEDRCHDTLCGRIFSLGGPIPVAETRIRVHAVHIDADHDVCLASAGSITAVR